MRTWKAAGKTYRLLVEMLKEYGIDTKDGRELAGSHDPADSLAADRLNGRQPIAHPAAEDGGQVHLPMANADENSASWLAELALLAPKTTGA